MIRTSKSISVALATIVVAAAAGPPSGLAAEDLRSPDARDAAGTALSAPAQDLRSPDARDAAGVGSGLSPAPAAASGATDWGDVGIIGGASVALALLGTGTLVARRRHRLSPAPSRAAIS
ncbi:MAG TPA: hypothetical protein VD931_05085 [Baekduia sp.]|nr:hypothetical protein [Baekduia sp.]